MADPNPPLWFRVIVYPFVMIAYAGCMLLDIITRNKK